MGLTDIIFSGNSCQQAQQRAQAFTTDAITLNPGTFAPVSGLFSSTSGNGVVFQGDPAYLPTSKTLIEKLQEQTDIWLRSVKI